MKTRIILCFASIFATQVAMAQTAEDKGLAIALEVDRKDQGWGDAIASLKMTLRNQQGEESLREIKVKSLEVKGDGDKTLTIFDTPRDLKGTAFLSFSHDVTPDDQWLYLPSIKRIKRIASANKSGPFMGSQFAFEDLSSFEVDKYSYKYLKDEKINNRDTYVVENIPKYKYSGYSRLTVWIDKQRHIPLQVKYYDRKNDLLKTLTFQDYKLYLDKYWRAHEQIMENHQNGKLTLLNWEEYQFKNGFSDRDFERNSLKRIR